MGTVDLKKLFAGMQSQMIAQLNTDREFITHSGSKGDALENMWIEWLRTYLPTRYCVEKAIVIDSEGKTSDQIDIVVYDNWYTPFIFSQNGFHYIPAEGVYAVFEVKPEITKEYIKYASDKVKSVRVLKRTSTSMINSGKKYNPRPLTKIVGGLLCSTSSLAKGIHDVIDKNVKENQGLSGLDLICVADTACVVIDYEGSEDNKEVDLIKRLYDYYANRQVRKTIHSKKETSLVTFILQFTHYLQQAIGTIPAIDFQQYLNTIDEKLDVDL